MADNTRKQAAALIRYLQFRAEKEGVDCALTAEQIESWMRQEPAMIFGITYDGGKLTGSDIYDRMEQEAEAQ